MCLLSAHLQNPLSVEIIVLAREHLAVDPTSPTGLRWKSHWSKRHQRFAGKPAGRKTNKGYWQVCISGRVIMAHRLVWFLKTGIDPAQYNVTIDHVNRDPSDNNIENLRLATDSEQQKNRGNYSYHTKPGRKIGDSGYRWVTKKGKSWMGQFTYKGKSYWTPTQDTPVKTYNAVLSLRKEMGLPCLQ